MSRRKSVADGPASTNSKKGRTWRKRPAKPTVADDNNTGEPKRRRVKSDRPWYVYVERNKADHSKVYTGATNRPWIRARQHNGELKGGAVTTARWGAGNAEMIMLIGPFESERQGLSFEKRMKIVKAKKDTGAVGGVRGRVRVLTTLLSLPGGKVSGRVSLGGRDEPLIVSTILSQAEFHSHLSNDHGEVLATTYAHYIFGVAALPPPKPK